jgi:hypothetical protein
MSELKLGPPKNQTHRNNFEIRTLLATDAVFANPKIYAMLGSIASSRSKNQWNRLHRLRKK